MNRRKNSINYLQTRIFIANIATPQIHRKITFPAGIYLLKVNNRNTILFIYFIIYLKLTNLHNFCINYAIKIAK